MVFGEGAPRGTFYANIDVKPFSAALDVVAHELTHGVTANSARLNSFPFSDAGALNEGVLRHVWRVATSFFYQAARQRRAAGDRIRHRQGSVRACGAFSGPSRIAHDFRIRS